MESYAGDLSSTKVQDQADITNAVAQCSPPRQGPGPASSKNSMATHHDDQARILASDDGSDNGSSDQSTPNSPQFFLPANAFMCLDPDQAPASSFSSPFDEEDHSSMWPAYSSTPFPDYSSFGAIVGGSHGLHADASMCHDSLSVPVLHDSPNMMHGNMDNPNMLLGLNAYISHQMNIAAQHHLCYAGSSPSPNYSLNIHEAGIHDYTSNVADHAINMVQQRNSDTNGEQGQSWYNFLQLTADDQVLEHPQGASVTTSHHHHHPQFASAFTHPDDIVSDPYHGMTDNTNLTMQASPVLQNQLTAFQERDHISHGSLARMLKKRRAPDGEIHDSWPVVAQPYLPPSKMTKSPGLTSAHHHVNTISQHSSIIMNYNMSDSTSNPAPLSPCIDYKAVNKHSGSPTLSNDSHNPPQRRLTKGSTRQSVCNDPQSIAARHRRERISERLKTLQALVPNGSKVDLVTMLEKAISYVKSLQLQVKVLSTDEYWPTPLSDKFPINNLAAVAKLAASTYG